jgi:hypothetical protein
MRFIDPIPYFSEISRPLIEESFHTFTAALDYNNPNHTLQRTPSPKPHYVGPPNPEIDQAWEDIVGGKLSPLILMNLTYQYFAQ